MDEEKTGDYVEVPKEGELTLTELLHKYWPDLPSEAVERGVALHERLALDRTIYGTSFATVHDEAPHVRRVTIPELSALEAAGSREVFYTKPRRLRPYGMPTAAAMETFDRIRANLALAAAGNERLTNYLTMDWDGAVTVSDPEVNEALVMTTMRRLTQ